jgi:hypothetical protein
LTQVFDSPFFLARKRKRQTGPLKADKYLSLSLFFFS